MYVGTSFSKIGRPHYEDREMYREMHREMRVGKSRGVYADLKNSRRHEGMMV
jgi:hypothetical protein